MRYLLFLLLFAPAALQAQNSNSDSTGLPGDNFDLYGALELFKTASNLEAFEEALNKQNNEINNLDLNEDGQVDYIQVIDNMVKDTHALVLRVAVSETENQDIAVIGIEKTGDNSAVLQIVGDEELYGENYILEPAEEATEKSGKGPAAYAAYAMPRPAIVIVNVWYWPGVRYMYAPTYVVYRSPWRWRMYPVWWTPWRPVAWRIHHARVVRYRHVYCRRVTVYRVHHAHHVYYPHRTASPTVQRRRTAPTQVQRNQQQRNQPAQQTQRSSTNKQQVKAQNNQQAKPQSRPAQKAQATPRSKPQKGPRQTAPRSASKPTSRPR